MLAVAQRHQITPLQLARRHLQYRRRHGGDAADAPEGQHRLGRAQRSARQDGQGAEAALVLTLVRARVQGAVQGVQRQRPHHGRHQRRRCRLQAGLPYRLHGQLHQLIQQRNTGCLEGVGGRLCATALMVASTAHTRKGAACSHGPSLAPRTSTCTSSPSNTGPAAGAAACGAAACRLRCCRPAPGIPSTDPLQVRGCTAIVVAQLGARLGGPAGPATTGLARASIGRAAQLQGLFPATLAALVRSVARCRAAWPPP